MVSVRTGRRALLAVLLVACSFPPSALASARLDRTEAKIVRAINQLRTAHDVPRLRISGGLARAADAHSKTMARSGRLAHGDTGRRVRRYVRSRRVGENLAATTRCRARAIVRMWLRSAGHRRIMLSPGFRRVGVAKRNASSTCFVTADFAGPR